MRLRPVADDLGLRDAVEGDLAILFDQQRDPDARHMAAFLSRDPSDWDAFLTHWTRILADPHGDHEDDRLRRPGGWLGGKL
jgi:hypothetical protein